MLLDYLGTDNISYCGVKRKKKTHPVWPGLAGVLAKDAFSPDTRADLGLGHGQYVSSECVLGRAVPELLQVLLALKTVCAAVKPLLQ
jgi:hypothetical protein